MIISQRGLFQVGAQGIVVACFHWSDEWSGDYPFSKREGPEKTNPSTPPSLAITTANRPSHRRSRCNANDLMLDTRFAIDRCAAPT
jgi:hypothetical protein